MGFFKFEKQFNILEVSSIIRADKLKIFSNICNIFCCNMHFSVVRSSGGSAACN
jgi:hypothetical protein